MAQLWLIHASQMIKNCAVGYEELPHSLWPLFS